MTNTIPAVIGYHEAPTEIDPAQLTWAPGYPSHDGVNRIQWSVWHHHHDPEQSTRLASLHTAIVRDTVCHYEHSTTMYGLVQDTRLRSYESHHPMVAWRIMRESDGAVLYDSMTMACTYHRVVHADVPMAWGDVVRNLRN